MMPHGLPGFAPGPSEFVKPERIATGFAGGFRSAIGALDFVRSRSRRCVDEWDLAGS